MLEKIENYINGVICNGEKIIHAVSFSDIMGGDSIQVSYMLKSDYYKSTERNILMNVKFPTGTNNVSIICGKSNISHFIISKHLVLMHDRVSKLKSILQ